ncbi:MAG: TrmH family RNA methyltransferase [Pseudonocardiaceae bacterium]
MELQQIGAQHPKIKQVLAIQRNIAPNPRKMIIAEGLWAHNLLLEHNSFVDTFLWCPEAAYGDEARKRAVELAARAHLAYQVSEKTLARISERDRPDGLFSIASLPTWKPEDVRLGDSSLIMVADGMEIPGNLGTLIRTLDTAGADCLVLTNRRTRLTHPKVFRASQGMVLTIPVLDFERVADAISWLRSNNVNIYLADTDSAKNYRSFDYSSTRTAFVLGSERYGIPKLWYETGCERVFIPMLGSADSLNVSISAAVFLFEARAQKNHW